MMLVKLTFLFLILFGVPLVAVSDATLVARAQGELSPPIDVSAVDGSGVGEVVVRWAPIPEAAYYRIGWVAYDDYHAFRDAGRNWLEAFVFVDVENRGQVERLVTRLTPGIRYAFIVASVDARYGVPHWSSWVSHTPAEAPVEVDASGLAAPDWVETSGGLRLGSVDLSWSSVNGADSYLIWYSHANGDGHQWVRADNKSDTISDAEPGLFYRFAVAASSTDAEGNRVYGPFSEAVFVRPTSDANTSQSTGTFSQVTVGDSHSCGLTTGAAIQCWGSNRYGQLNAPLGQFVSVHAGSHHSCALRKNGSVVCWGNTGDEGKTLPPDETFSQIDVGSQHACGITSRSTIACWGANRSGEGNPPEGTFEAVSVSKNIRGSAHSCGIRTDGSAVCWGSDYAGRLRVPPGMLTSISSGDTHNCGFDSDGTLACAGSNQYGQSDVPEGTYDAVSLGGRYTCARKIDASVVCWGEDIRGETVVPEGIYASVSAGYTHTCGVKSNGRVLCWGNNDDGQSLPP